MQTLSALSEEHAAMTEEIASGAGEQKELAEEAGEEAANAEKAAAAAAETLRRIKL